MNAVQRTLSGICFVCLAAWCVLAWYAFRNSSETLLQVESRVYDVGRMRQRETRVANFRLKNAAEAPLTLITFLHSCGCTVVRPKRTQLAPQDETEVKVEFASGVSAGARKVRVAVVYKLADDSKRHLLPLRIDAIVDPEYDVQPESLIFHRLLAQRRCVEISCREAECVRITKIECNRACFEAGLISGWSNQAGARIHVDFNPEHCKPGEDIDGQMTVWMDNPRLPVIRVPLLYRADKRVGNSVSKAISRIGEGRDK